MKRIELENALLELIETFTGLLPREQVKDFAGLVRAGEPGIAFENLCTQLYEYDIVVNREVLGELKVVGSAMGLESKYWDRLKEM